VAEDRPDAHPDHGGRAALPGRGLPFPDLDIVDVRRGLPAFYAKVGFAPFDMTPFRDLHRLTQPVHLVLMTKPLVDIWA
jgi:hypothetical protein